jgi:hypothetical protein
MKKISIYLLLFLSNNIFAQSGVDINSMSGNSGISSRINNLLSDDLRTILNSRTVSKSDSEIEGSIFFDKNYRTAKIAGVTGSWPIRYDAYRDEMEVKKNGEIFALKKEEPFNEIIFIEKSNKVILAEFIVDKKKEKGYLYEVLSTPNYLLYKKQTVIFKKGKEPNTTLEIATPNRFIPASPIYFIKKSGNNEFIEIDKKAKNLIATMPDNKNKITKCLKESKLDLKDEFSVKNFTRCIND